MRPGTLRMLHTVRRTLRTSLYIYLGIGAAVPAYMGGAFLYSEYQKPTPSSWPFMLRMDLHGVRAMHAAGTEPHVLTRALEALLDAEADLGKDEQALQTLVEVHVAAAEDYDRMHELEAADRHLQAALALVEGRESRIAWPILSRYLVERGRVDEARGDVAAASASLWRAIRAHKAHANPDSKSVSETVTMSSLPEAEPVVSTAMLPPRGSIDADLFRATHELARFTLAQAIQRAHRWSLRRLWSSDAQEWRDLCGLYGSLVAGASRVVPSQVPPFTACEIRIEYAECLAHQGNVPAAIEETESAYKLAQMGRQWVEAQATATSATRKLYIRQLAGAGAYAIITSAELQRKHQRLGAEPTQKLYLEAIRLARAAQRPDLESRAVKGIDALPLRDGVRRYVQDPTIPSAFSTFSSDLIGLSDMK